MPLSWEEETEWDICLRYDGPKFSTDSGLAPMRGTNVSGEIYVDWSLNIIAGKRSDISLLCKHFGHRVF